MRGRCEHTGLAKPECSCRPCTLDTMRKHGSIQLTRILNGKDHDGEALPTEARRQRDPL